MKIKNIISLAMVFILPLIIHVIMGQILPYPEPVTNGYVIEKIYSVVIENNNGDTREVELTEDQFNYTKIGQWIDLEMAEGVNGE